MFSQESLLSLILNDITLGMILKKFAYEHKYVDENTRDIILHQPVKLKIIKTMTDEALILLYRYDSSKKEPPLLGVYFDIALASLAPLTILPELTLG